MKYNFLFSSKQTLYSYDDDEPAHTANRHYIATNYSEFISEDEWTPNSSDLSLMDYHVWRGILERCISTQAGEHRQAQSSSTADMEPAATGLNQQSHIYLLKRLLVCVNAGDTIRT